jgi:hypothetical protein
MLYSNYAIRKVQGNQVGEELNGTHQLLVYTDDFNLQDKKYKLKKRHTSFSKAGLKHPTRMLLEHVDP